MSMDSGAMPGDRITGWLDTGTIYEIIEAKSQDIGVTWLDIALRSRGRIAMSENIVTRWLDIVTSNASSAVTFIAAFRRALPARPHRCVQAPRINSHSICCRRRTFASHSSHLASSYIYGTARRW